METPLQSQTLYINNINEKIKKNVLKKMLYMVFAQYGKVIDIVASKGLKLRGQAWVVFEDIGAATNALRGKQGFNFYGKPLRIAFAKTKSKIVERKENLVVSQGKSNKRPREDDGSVSGSSSGPAAKRTTGQANKILYVKDLPVSITQQALISLFSQAQGFVEIRIPPGDVHQGTAFVEFIDDASATVALKQLDGFQLSPTDKLKLSYSQ